MAVKSCPSINRARIEHGDIAVSLLLGRIRLCYLPSTLADLNARANKLMTEITSSQMPTRANA